MKVEIRPAEMTDLKSVCDLADQINEQHHRALPEIFATPEAYGRDREYWLKQIKQDDTLFLVACRNGSIHGFITAEIQNGSAIPFLQQTKVCKIGTVVVDAASRGEGIGSLFMAYAERWAARSGAVEIRLQVMDFNTQAQTFYAQHEYRPLSHTLCKPLAPQPDETKPLPEPQTAAETRTSTADREVPAPD